jgi:hypothetical protein
LLVKDIQKLFKAPTCDINVLSSHRWTPVKSFCNRFHYKIIISLVIFHAFKLLWLLKLFKLDPS